MFPEENTIISTALTKLKNSFPFHHITHISYIKKKTEKELNLKSIISVERQKRKDKEFTNNLRNCTETFSLKEGMIYSRSPEIYKMTYTVYNEFEPW